MVSMGSKALPLRKHISVNLIEDIPMNMEDGTSKYKSGKQKKMSRKAKEKRAGFRGDHSAENQSNGAPNESGRHQKSAKDQNASESQASIIRKQIDPETAKYFTEIANVIEGKEIDLEERSVVCGNALEEARGKEVELATDYIISHTMQTLLEGCSLDHLCGFLQSCAHMFSQIAMDRSGSHVAETALKSLSMHLEDREAHSLIEETLTKLCQEIVINPVDVMCNCYGSHVLRSLLCLCKGVPLDSSEFHATKSSTVLAERLNLKSARSDSHRSRSLPQFPDQLKFLVSEMLSSSRLDIASLQVNQYSSLVLQTALKFLVEHEQELMHLIKILLGCNVEDAGEGSTIEAAAARNILSLVEESAYSRLMEVIVELAPDTLYNEILTKVFKDSLFQMSSNPCANFVVQALVSHARHKDHMELIWFELGSRFRDLLEMGRSGVIASALSASQKLHSHEHKCCQALAAAVRAENESTGCIVPRLLFLDNYFLSNSKASWNWPNGVKMHVVGSLILQSVFGLPSEFIQAYISSITSLEDSEVLEASKDPSGARVIEAFLSSNASAKRKRKLVIRLRGHFGELAAHPSGSFTVEKCFSTSNVSLREAIVSELLPVQTELSKTKQGPYLLKKFDVEGYAKRPDQWRSQQSSKQSTYKEFCATFGSTETKSSKSVGFLAETDRKTRPEKMKEMRNEINTRLSPRDAFNPAAQFLAHPSSARVTKSGIKRGPDGAFKGRSKRHKK